MAAPDYGIVVYRTTSAAVRSEKVLREQGYEVRVVAVPRSLSTDCCLGLRVPWDSREKIADALEGAGIEFVALREWPH